MMEKPLFPQALTTSFFSRVKNENTSIYISTQTSRTNKRSAAVVNYAEDYYDDFAEEDSDYPSRKKLHQDSYYTNNASNALSNPLLQNFTGKVANKTPHQYFSDEELLAQSKLDTELIPIRINVETQNNARIVDFFMWNINESLVTPEQYAQIFCQDLELPNSVQSQISSSIRLQIEDYSQLVRIKLPEDASIHVIIDLNVNLDKQLYEDKFEWDLTNSEITSKNDNDKKSKSEGLITPEQFAELVVADMGLPREFYPAIAHSLHEQILKLKREALEGRLPQEVVNGAAYHREAGWRFDPENLGGEWSPTFETLSQWEIERREIERERNIRRLKRESMRVGDDMIGGPGGSGVAGSNGAEGGRSSRRRGGRRYDELEGSWVNY